jgi:hypothetical protein
MNINDYDYRVTDAPNYGRNAMGYGSKIPTQHMVKWHGRWRRVYVVCWGNSGTPYVVVNKQPHYL